MSSSGSDSGKFHPPKWCRVPRHPRRQPLLFVVDDPSGTTSSQPSGVELCTKALYTIGRADTGVDVRLKGDKASRLHAAICQDAEGRKFLVDLRSTHGTFLDEKRLAPHTPVRWNAGVKASFGGGPTAEVMELGPLPDSGEGDVSNGEAVASRLKEGSDAEGAPPPPKKQKADDPLAALYGDLPEAKVTEVAPRVEERRPQLEVLPKPKEPTKVIFLDIDGVVRTVHGRTDFQKDVRSMVVNGQRVALLGNSQNGNIAGIDFWPLAMRAVRHIVAKTGAAVVLSSDWRKQEELIEGVNNQMHEYGMPSLHGITPDLDGKNVLGVVKALHTNVREKRAKEIRRWLRQHPKVERWVAIDDMDLSASRKDEILHQQNGSSEPMPFLDPGSNFVRCNPAVGLTFELAKLAVAFLNGADVTEQDLQAAYGQAPAEPAADPNFQGLGPGLLG